MKETNKTILLTIFYIMGLIGFFTLKVPLLALISLAGILFLLAKNFISNRFSIVLYLIFAFGIFNCSIKIKNSDDLSVIAPAETTISARVTSIPTTNNADKTKFYARVLNFKNEKQFVNSKSKLLISIKDKKSNLKNIEIGDLIEAKGFLATPFESQNPNQFDYSSYLKNVGVHSIFYSQAPDWKIKKKADTKFWKFLQSINRTRSSAIEKHSHNIKSPNIELLGGIVFGDDAINPPDELKQSFLNSGLLHILTASGMNVTMIFALWFFIAQKLNINYKFSTLTGIFLVLFYTCMTGFGPSIVRATIMLVFILLGRLINRSASTISLLFFVALLMLLHNPALINSISFQLSFTVTFGLLLTCPVIFDKIDNKILNTLATTVLVPVIAQLYVAPIQMFYFGTFSTYSVFANIAIIPFLTAATFIGFFSSLITMLPFVCKLFCQISDFVLNPFLSAIVFISDFFSSLPNSLIHTFHPSVLQIFLYYLSLLLATLLGYLSLREEKSQKTIAITVLLFFISLSSLLINLFPVKNQNCEIIFFSVGNADSALIKTPNSHYILIDTGKKPYKTGDSQAKQIILKYLGDNQIKKLDALILTHFDSDHAGGTVDILNQVPVDTVYFPAESEKTELSEQILKTLISKKIKTANPKEREIILKDNGFIIRDITPKSAKLSGDNEHSLIDLVSFGEKNILFLADAESNEFDYYRKQLPEKIEILKVGHHGSYDSTSEAMLKKLHPKIAIISTGYNSYGHPSEKTIDLFKKYKVKTYRTDYNNAIKVVLTNEQTKIYTYKTSKKMFTREKGQYEKYQQNSDN